MPPTVNEPPVIYGRPDMPPTVNEPPGRGSAEEGGYCVGGGRVGE